jgi:large subunit ribosomal protein L22
MQVTSTYRYARISAFKAREVTREIQGHSASDALDLLTFSPKKAAVLVKKTLRSAIANAENNNDLRVDTLRVKEAVVGEGPTFKRFRARARGGASPILKRTSHIRIVLSDEDGVPAPQGKERKAARGQAAAAEASTEKKPTGARAARARKTRSAEAPHRTRKKMEGAASSAPQKSESSESAAPAEPTKE